MRFKCALPSRTNPRGHDPRLHRSQAWAQAGHVRCSRVGRDPGRNLWRHSLPRASDADRQPPGRLFVGRSRYSAAGHGKKNAEEMARQRERFIKGAAERGFPPKKMAKIFDLMEQFAGYGFNKSHSAAYAYLAFITAYLKAHYSVEFMSALLTSEAGNTDKIVKYIN